MKNRDRIIQYLYSNEETVGLDDRGDVITRLICDGATVSTKVIRLLPDSEAHNTRCFDFTSLPAVGDELFYFLEESMELFTMDLQAVLAWSKKGKVSFEVFNKEPELRGKINIKKVNLG